MISIVLTSHAEEDLDDIGAYLKNKAGRTTAKKFIGLIKNHIHLLHYQPFMCAVQPKLGINTRRMVVKSYLVFYRVEHETIYITRVLHSARKITKKMMR